MTVHVHASITEVAGADHHHTRTGIRVTKKGKTKQAKKGALGATTERTWSFNCTPACETRVIADCEFAANHPAGVPLTYDEKLRVADEQQQSNVDMGHLARALKVATELERNPVGASA